MPNTINTLKNAPGVIAKLAAGMLEDKVQFSKSIDKADSSDYDGKNGYQAGDTIYISKPARFIPSTNADITSSIQDVTEEKVALTLDTRFVVPIALTSSEIATDMALQGWAKRVLEPAVSSMAQYIENNFLTKATQAVANGVGIAGSTVFDNDTVLAAGQKINEFACPDFDNRFVLLNPAANRSAVNARKGLFQSSADIAEQYRKGYMGMSDGFEFLSNNLVYNHTAGTANVSGVTASANLTSGSASIALAGLGNTLTVTRGTVFQIAGVNAVHPITKQDLGYPKQFVVSATVTSNAGGAATVVATEVVYSSAGGSLQNVSSLAANGQTVTFFQPAASSVRAQNLAYHKSAFRMVSVPLVKPDGLDMSAQETSDGGFTIRVIRDYDVLTDKLIMRLDFLGGIAAVRPEWAARITA
jgi:hypothetical protein